MASFLSPLAATSTVMFGHQCRECIHRTAGISLGVIRRIFPANESPMTIDLQMRPAARPISPLLPLLAVTLLLSLSGCDRPASEAEVGILPEGILQKIPFDAVPFDVLADDIDGNGLIDLTWVSRTSSTMQVFYQRESRIFEPGPHIDAVGYHPGTLIRLTDQPDGQRLYMMSSEGLNRLTFFSPDSAGRLETISSLEAPVPRYATEFRWPGQGRGLAIAPFATGTLVLMKSVDPLAATTAESYQIPLAQQLSRISAIMAADLDGDEVDEILFIDTTDNVIFKIRSPVPGGVPRIEPVWQPEVETAFLWRMSLVDLDESGSPDLLVPADGLGDLELGPVSRDGAERVPATIRVLLNDGAGTLVETAAIPFPRSPLIPEVVSTIRDVAFARDTDGQALMLIPSVTGLALMRLDPARLDEGGESLVIPAASGGFDRALLVDLDGDGQLDAVLSRAGAVKETGLIIYGPLWESFGTIIAAGQGI